MTLHQLRIFESVARLLNITKASETLHLSQPSVSHQLKLLEEEFGKKFFVRLSQGVELTSEGKEFFNAVNPILGQAEIVEKTFKSSGRANSGALLKLGGSNNVSVDILPRLLMQFKKIHPSVHFILETQDSPVIEKRLLNGELEIALITNPSYRSELTYEPYGEMDVVAFCPSTNPQAGKTLSLQQLVACPLVVRSGGRIEAALLSRDHKVNIAVRCEASAAVKAAVKLGMGIGVLYRNAIEGRLAGGSFKLINVPELKDMGVRSFIIYDKRKPLAPTAQEFLEILRERKNVAVERQEGKFRSGVRLSLH